MNRKTRSECLVVIGGDAAGMSAASRAKRTNPKLEVIALERTRYVSYSACGIPYFIAGLVKKAEDLIAITPEEFRTERGIDVRTRHEVVGIDPVKNRVRVIDLELKHEFEIEYDKLILAVGGAPVRPRMDGLDLKNVFSVHTLQDGIDLKGFIDEPASSGPKRAVIVGAGYIGLEMAEAFTLRGMEVTVLEKMDRVLGSVDEDISRVVEEELLRQGVKLVKNTTVTALLGNDAGEVVSARTKENSREYPADLVLLGIGVKPNVTLAREAGLRLGSTGAVAVDQKMQTSLPNIYAAGDCVEVKHLVSGKFAYIPLGPTANKQGRVAGENAAGGFAIFKGVVGTAVTKVFDLEVARTGLSTAEAEAAGFKPVAVTVTDHATAPYWPTNKPITLRLIADKPTKRLLGAQMVGEMGVAKRIDILAAALHAKMTIEDVMRLDLSYAPPYAPVWDPVLVAANVLSKQWRSS